jgi:predicted exporter
VLGRRGSVAFLLGVGILGVWLVGNLHLTTSIVHFLPAGEDRELAGLARQMSSSDLNRAITLTIEAPDRDAAAQAVGRMADDLEDNPEVAWVRAGPDEELQEAFYALYFPRRLAFLTDGDPAEVLSDDGLRGRIAELRRRLGGPMGTFLRGIAPEDPLLAFPTHLDRLREAQEDGLSTHRGRFVTADGRHGVLFLASAASAFDTAAARRLETAIEGAFDRAAATVPGLRLEQSAVHRFALTSEASIRADITRVSVLSTVGVAVLFLLLFRSPLRLLLSAVPIASGVVAGLAATQAAFGQVHGLSLAFGATLIGVGIDYVAHYLNHHTLAPHRDGAVGSLRVVGAGLVLGCATTVAGLAGLAWTAFPGIRELAVFTSVGVSTALLATALVLPPALPGQPVATPLHRGIAAWLGGAFDGLGRRRRLLWILPVLATLITLGGLARLRWVDDLRALTAMDPALLAEEERVRARVSRLDGGRFVVALGDTLEEALEVNDAVAVRLRDAVEAGDLDRVQTLHTFLWSRALQERNLRAVQDADLAARLPGALSAEGMVPEAFAPWEVSDVEPLTLETLQASPLGPLVSPFHLRLGEREAVLTFLRGGDLETLERRLEGLPGARVFDQAAFLGQTYERFRTRTLELMGLGLVAVFLLVLLRYRDLRLALAAFLPAVLAAATALGGLALAGFSANLMHVTALLLVLSMGVDYGVFMVESRGHPEGPRVTVVSLVVACASTMLSFGLLAMSANPALQALGLVTGIGVGLSLLLAPSAWLLVGPRR